MPSIANKPERTLLLHLMSLISPRWVRHFESHPGFYLTQAPSISWGRPKNGENMVSDLGELISRYETAQQRIAELVAAAADSESELLEADKALIAAFDAIMNLRPTANEQVLERIQFLLQQIVFNQPKNELIQQLSDQVLQDLADCQREVESSP